MRFLLTRILWLVAAILCAALATYAYLGNPFRVSADTAEVMLFIVAGLVPVAYLLQREEPLAVLSDNVWVCAGTMTVFALLDTVLRLGHLKHGLLTYLPIHVFTLYVWWMMERNDRLNRQQDCLILVLAGVALFLSAIFNYG